MGRGIFLLWRIDLSWSGMKTPENNFDIILLFSTDLIIMEAK